MWRVLSVHVNNDYANNTRGDCRKTLADLTCLALRDKVDIQTGDFNQAGGYLEECVFQLQGCIVNQAFILKAATTENVLKSRLVNAR